MHIAYNLGHRVVTMNGELIELSGKMTANGKNPRRGLMRFTEDG
jgi:chromosome segregation ATPase